MNKEVIITDCFKTPIEEIIFKEYGFNHIQLKFADFFLAVLDREYGSYFPPDYLHLPFNENREIKIDKNDVSYVIQKLYRKFQFVESDRDELSFKLSYSGKEIIQVYKLFSTYITNEVEKKIVHEKFENEDRKRKEKLDQLNIKQLKYLVFQGKWWILIMLLNMILSVAAAYLLFTLGIH